MNDGVLCARFMGGEVVHWSRSLGGSALKEREECGAPLCLAPSSLVSNWEWNRPGNRPGIGQPQDMRTPGEHGRPMGDPLRQGCSKRELLRCWVARWISSPGFPLSWDFVFHCGHHTLLHPHYLIVGPPGCQDSWCHLASNCEAMASLGCKCCNW